MQRVMIAALMTCFTATSRARVDRHQRVVLQLTLLFSLPSLASVPASGDLHFVAPKGYRPETGELRFDMYEGEYTHVAGSCRRICASRR